MRSIPLAEEMRAEERLVAELELLGIRYLSRLTAEQAQEVRPAADLLADLVQRPSARVRLAVIAVLLAHPELACAMLQALAQLPRDGQQTLRLHYPAARLLQQEHAERLRPFAALRRLPRRFAVDLGMPADQPVDVQLAALAAHHRRELHAHVNWAGPYESVVHALLRSWEAARRWSQ